MNTADLITSFFNNELSPDQERQFLLSVASSDSLRLGLKSHVMLDKILNEQSSRAVVPLGVRTTIMREAAVMAAAAGSALAANQAHAETDNHHDPAQTKPAASNPMLSAPRKFFRWSSAALVLLFSTGSFLVGFYTGNDATDNPTNSPAQVTTQGQLMQNSPIVAPPASVIASEGENSASLPVSSSAMNSVESSNDGAVNNQAKSPTVAERKGSTLATRTSSHSAGKGTKENSVTQSSSSLNQVQTSDPSSTDGNNGVEVGDLEIHQSNGTPPTTPKNK